MHMQPLLYLLGLQIIWLYEIRREQYTNLWDCLASSRRTGIDRWLTEIHQQHIGHQGYPLLADHQSCCQQWLHRGLVQRLESSLLWKWLQLGSLFEPDEGTWFFLLWSILKVSNDSRFTGLNRVQMEKVVRIFQWYLLL